MISALLAVFMFAAPVQAPKSQCETLAPNLDGISVTICGGEVVQKCDASGNCLFSASTY